MIQLFQSKNVNCYFSVRGNGVFNNVIRTGWMKSKISKQAQEKILEAINNDHVDMVYRRGNKIYKLMLDGNEQVIYIYNIKKVS